jgi:hypothetical protein
MSDFEYDDAVTPAHGRFQRAALSPDLSPGRRDPARAAIAEARRAMIRRLWRRAVTVLAAGVAVAAIHALKAAIYLWRFDY